MALDGAKRINQRHADHPRSILAFLETRLGTRFETLLEMFLETRLGTRLETHLETFLETRLEKLCEKRLVRALPFGCKDGHPIFLSIILALRDPLDGHPSGALQAYA